MSSAKPYSESIFEAALENFHDACRAVDLVEQRYEVAGRPVRLRFAGTGLAGQLTPSLAHLEVASAGEPDLTVCLWDRACHPTPLPDLVQELVNGCRQHCQDWLGNRKEITRLHGKRMRAMFHIGPNILSLFVPERRLALYWLPDAAKLPYWEQGSPMLTIFSWWLETAGCQLLHAAALSDGTAGLLLAGRGGSGKSTSTLACLGSPLKILGDDYCILETGNGLMVHSLYGTAKLNGDADLQRFPHLRAVVSNPQRSQDEKALILLNTVYRREIAHAVPARGLLVPRITASRDTRVEPISRGTALRHLAPSTLFQLSGSGQLALQRMSELIGKVQPGELRLGRELSQIPEAIRSYLGKCAIPKSR